MHPLERSTVGGKKLSDHNRVAKVTTAIQHCRKSQFARLVGMGSSISTSKGLRNER